ncbi:hypothetical protein ACTWPT_51425 [Nonomuraea sp. 3N208]|uniref:hypothetical protein n=1 Tax=Nonomuraea sp. 3N208 TaxID=3457421 RepID=UPI003FD17E7C
MRDLSDGVFQKIATCDSMWQNVIRNCNGKQGLNADGPTPCTGGANWDAASYSICEKQGDPAEVVGTAYVYSSSGFFDRMPACWASEDEKRRMAEEAMEASGAWGVRVVHRHGETTYEPL